MVTNMKKRILISVLLLALLFGILFGGIFLLRKNANEKDIQKLEIYQKGYIYLQSLSSMVPPLVLNPKLKQRTWFQL